MILITGGWVFVHRRRLNSRNDPKKDMPVQIYKYDQDSIRF